MTKVRANSGALGFPRMGPNREMKFALEKHWRGAIDEKAMLAAARSVEDQAWAVQMEAGVGQIAAGDHCLYDNMLAWWVWFLFVGHMRRLRKYACFLFSSCVCATYVCLLWCMSLP